jgi:hypothetical protein
MTECLPFWAVNLKKMLLRAVGMSRMLSVLRAVGFLALFSALLMEFHRESPIANEGVAGGGGGGNVSIFIRGGSDSGVITTEMMLEASTVTERNDVAHDEDDVVKELEPKPTSNSLTAAASEKINDATHSMYNDEKVKTDEHQQLASIVASRLADESSKTIDADDCDGCDEKKAMPNASTPIDDNVNITRPETSEQPVLISVGGIHPSNSTTPVEQIILLGERHSGTELIADHLAKCFDIKVSV